MGTGRGIEEMKLETFFEKFELFADAPDAVAKMRELVLRLAVEGGLVPHSAAEPAVPYASVEDATPINVSEVPENWRVVLLADAIKNRSGNSKLIKGKLHEEPAAGRFQGFSASGADVWCDDYEHEGQAIIISAVGARCGKAFKASGKWCAIANTNITRPEPTLFDFDFAYLVLNNEHFWVRGGSAQPFVKFPPSLDRHFAVPPLAEQKRIVAKVDELMALCDRLEAQQQEREKQASQLARASLARFSDAPTPANLQFLFHPSYNIPPADLRKSILTLAVHGKLVPQDPNDEPAEELFERIQAERAEQEAIGAYKRCRPFEPIEETEIPFNLPAEWKWARLRSLVFILGDGLHGTPEYSAGTDCYFINGNNLVDGQIVIKPHTKTVSLDEAKKHRKPMTLSTVLVSINGTLGSVAFYNNENVILGKSACYLNLASLVDKHFVRRVIQSPYFVNYASENATGTTIRNLGLKAMNSFPFPLPPLAEQRRIVAKVEQLMALVDALETQLATSRTTAENLLTSLVTELTTS
jgi:restriction endonuclease S subunit